MSGPRVPSDGDTNRDGGADLADFEVVAECVHGPDTATPPPFCDPCDFSNADMDGDGEVDIHDFAEFTRVFTGG